MFFEQEQIALLEWPANSPDLNIIENVWGYLAQAVYRGGRQFSSVTLLKNAVLREWENIPQEYIKNLYETLKKRIADVLVYKGGPTTY